MLQVDATAVVAVTAAAVVAAVAVHASIQLTDTSVTENINM
jgi:hypothetical protein